MSLWSSYGVPVRDTLFNLLSGLGTAKDPRTSARFVFRELRRDQVENMYRGDWLARRLVDLPAEDATREWRTWQADPKKIDAIEKLEKKFELQKKTRQALQRARLYGGAALVIGVDQGDPSEELDYERVGKDDLKFVVVLNKYELTPGPRIYDVDSPYYTRPSYYQVATPISGFSGEGRTNGVSPAGYQAGSPRMLPFPSDKSLQMVPFSGPVYIHPSRVLEFVGNEIPDWRLVPMGGGWGDSILQTVDDSLRDFAMIVGGLASLINDMKMDVVKVPDLSRKLLTPALSAKTLERFSISNASKSTINTLLLDKDEDWERIQTSFGSTPELIRVCMTLACAAGGIPESRIMGNAPNKGLAKAGGSGGEVDIKNYYDDIAAQQRTKYKPALLPLDICLQRSALGSFDPGIDYEWRPLYQPDPGAVAQTNLQKAQATQVYVGLGLINEDAMRDAVISQLDEDAVYPGLQDAIDKHGAEPEEPPPPPPGMMPPGAPGAPGGMPPLHADPRQQIGAVKPGPGQPPGLPKPPPQPQQGKDTWCGDYVPDQPRDESGKWTGGGEGGKKADVKARIGDFVHSNGDAIGQAARKTLGSVKSHQRELIAGAITAALYHGVGLDFPAEVESAIHGQIVNLAENLKVTNAMAHKVMSDAVTKLKSLRGVKDTIDADRAGVDAALVKLGKVLAKLEPRYRAQDYDPDQERDPHGGEGVSVPGNTSSDGRDS